MRIRIKMMNLRRVPLYATMVFTFLFLMTYVMFFNHGPPEEILAANQRLEENDPLHKNHGNNVHPDLKDEENEDFLESKKKWDKFVNDNSYVSIGDVYNSCNIGERIVVGKAILTHDKVTKRVKARVFVNYTFEVEYTGGEFSIDVTYNGRHLFDNHWDTCTIDEDEEERMVFCPYKAQMYSWHKDMRIPPYLPKGKYEVKGWLTDEEGETIICGIGRFVL